MASSIFPRRAHNATEKFDFLKIVGTHLFQRREFSALSFFYSILPRGGCRALIKAQLLKSTKELGGGGSKLEPEEIKKK